jgi:SAM-dependent methyltransferase
MSVEPYKWLAEHYDEFFTFHRPWFEKARRKILGPVLPQVKSACDLACGTGEVAVRMAAQGIRTFAVDLSPGMCRMTRRKARENRVPVRVIQGDMRDFRLPEAVDLVLCEADAVNHVPRKQDLERVAKSVARALRPGGYFYFDVNTRLCFEKWPMAWWFETPNTVLVTHGGCDLKHDRAWTTAEWFLRGKGGSWRRRSERVEEVCWSADEIRKTLRNAGFGPIRSWDAATLFDASEVGRGHRTFYLARVASR